jgi:hypothetical protein
MRTPYIPHIVGEEAMAQVRGRRGWLSVGITSSVPWPEQDVWLEYDGAEYILRGAKRPSDSEHTPSPCIHSPAPKQSDEELARLYRFVSIMGYFLGGYVDITGTTWGSHPIAYVGLRDRGSMLTIQGGKFNFSCNHMPIVEDDQTRKALAFLREGRRLRHVHEPYSFLSFFKVIESQFESKDRVNWVTNALDQLSEEDAVKRIKALRGQGIDVNKHLYDSGRSAVAHASIGRDIVDPDVPADRRRIVADLPIIAALAKRYIAVDAGVPDHMDLYSTRDRTQPWHALMTPKAVERLKAKGVVEDVAELGQFAETRVTVRLWPEAPAEQFTNMPFLVEGSGEGVLFYMAYNQRQTILLRFAIDVANGHVHTQLAESGMVDPEHATERDVEDFTRYFHSVIGNRTVELSVQGAEPVDCDVVIPVNIIPQVPEAAVARALNAFRRRKVQPPAAAEGQPAVASRRSE